jgi:hypothetical protein
VKHEIVMARALNIVLLLDCDAFKINRSLYKHTFSMSALPNGILLPDTQSITFIVAWRESLGMLGFVKGLITPGTWQA